MPNMTTAAKAVEFTLLGRELDGKDAAIPLLLQDANRAGGGVPDPFINERVVEVEAVYDLSRVARGDGEELKSSPSGDRLLALEAEDGTTLFIRADKLRDDLQRLYPDAIMADGSLDLSVLRDRDAASRGMVDWAWSRLSVLGIKPDPIIDEAKAKARDWILEKLGEQVKDKLEGLADFSASTLGAKALMWSIESQLAGDPGLYRWRSSSLNLAGRIRTDDPDLATEAEAGPLLVFIHGTGSHTAGSFGDLRAAGAAGDWEPLTKQFGERIFGFEHRTFSESPIDNALALAKILPTRARLALVTHSRGGLVGDLLCLGNLDDALIDAYRRATPQGKEEMGEDLAALHAEVAADEQRKLRALRDLLAEKNFQIERYVRVACPARGTTLLSDNIEVFLSGLLSLMSSVVGAVAGPGAAPVLSAFKRIVLEIADKRLDPHLVPGIEAMLTDAPMGSLLARAPRKQGVAMTVIAGDSEGDSLLKRLGLLFTDWMFFDQRDNDLVVDTSSMYAGLAAASGTRHLFDHGATVNHFSYFSNPRTRQALRDWLTSDKPTELTAFSPMEIGSELSALAAREHQRQRATRGAAPAPNTRPVVILLPGIMGTHLELRRGNQKPGAGNRVWFDPLHLMWGGLGEIRISNRKVPGNARQVREESLFQMFYGDLVEHLETTHLVIPFPYDWRLPVQKTADRLSDVVRHALDEHPDQPVRLLAHSMGGLVARAMIAMHDGIWQEIIDRSGGRFIMLGTPNNGSHMMVASLLGKADSMRKLARLDLAHPMQEVLDIVAGFPGAVQLLPRPGFTDTGKAQANDYLDGHTWEEYRKLNKDRWFGDGQVGVPTTDALAATRELWRDVLGESSPNGQGWRPKPILPVERVGYVYGQAKNTACGIVVENERLKMKGTAAGDGSVTWASGKLEFLPPGRCWHMPVEHGNLADTAEHFRAISELLTSGTTDRLGRLPASRGEEAAIRTYDVGPVPYPNDEELVRSLMSSTPQRRAVTKARQRLAVRVRAMDLRNAQSPLMCGHYVGDPIAGAEHHIDRHLVDGALRQRELLGLYPAAIGTSAVVLMPRREEESLRGTSRGAIIVGLGEMGRLTVGKVTETVRAGVLQFLLSTHDREKDGLSKLASGSGGVKQQEISLASLLIGYNSTTLGSVENFVDAIILGACEANRQYADATQTDRGLSELEFVELYQDTAISAAHAVRDAGKRLVSHLRRLDAELQPHDQLIEGRGMTPRLCATDAFGYWPRLMITDADHPEESCPPECYQARLASPIPDEVVRALLERDCPKVAAGAKDDIETETSADASFERPRPAVAARLKYVFLAARARAEEIVHQRQPGLVEDLVVQAIRSDRYDADLARTLFQLMIPPEFKATARDLERLALVVDGYTANLPWEMLQADDEPLILKTAMVRQLASARFRQKVHSTIGKTACIIADPSTRGYRQQFGSRRNKDLPRLPGAAEEGRAVRELLETSGYQVTFVPPDSEALDVMTRLFRSHYRILMIAAHGVFQAVARDGGLRSGVVLSNGVLLTAAEVGQLEVVPEVAFLNCCHLGKVDNKPTLPTDVNRLAYSLARELIEIGVRCVVVAGWAVNDQAAKTFAGTFFHDLVAGRRFGDAIHAARRSAYEAHPGINTWGAYQAYGDPTFVLETGTSRSNSKLDSPVATAELLADISRLRDNARYRELRNIDEAQQRIRALLVGAPPSWTDLPEVQAAVGRLYSEFGQEGFKPARAAYERAIAAQDPQGQVAVKTIEQLANLEARTAEQMCDQRNLSTSALKTCVRDEALKLVEKAIARLQYLIDITAKADDVPSPAASGPVRRANLERWSLLGSAYKRKAKLLTDADRAWSTIAEALQEAQNAYRTGEGSPEDRDFDPYAMINRLHLDTVLNPADALQHVTGLARKCQGAARLRFKSTYAFWDSVKVADAELAIALAKKNVPDTETEKRIVRSYDDAAATVGKSIREFDSVIVQLSLLARFFEYRKDKDRSESVKRIASALAADGGPGRPADQVSDTTQPTADASQHREQKTNTRKKAKPRR